MPRSRKSKRGAKARRGTKRFRGRRRYVGGMYNNIVKFEVNLIDEEGNQLSHELIHENEQAIVGSFNDVVNELISRGEITERHITEIEFGHTEENKFEMTFSFVYQHANSQVTNQMRNYYTELIMEASQEMIQLSLEDKTYRLVPIIGSPV